MAYEVKVSTGDVQSKAQRVQQGAADIEQQLGQLTGQMAGLAGTWTGAASNSFRALFDDWKTTATSMKHALEEIGRSLNSAGQDYDALESKLAGQFR